MDIVNGFDIDTPEGATAYLESEGVDVEAYVKRGMAELKRHKTLGLAHVVKSGCRYCGGHNILSFDNDKYCKDCDTML